MYIVGHCLVWHSQTPAWFFIDEEGNEVSREVLIERMREHITTLVTRYKGKVDAWDVLPSPFENAGANISDKAEYTEFMNPYKEGLPDDLAKQMNERWVELFEIFLSHQDKIKRVTTWGVADPDSWKNGWPIPGRTDYALLFDRRYEGKPPLEKSSKKQRNEGGKIFS